MSSGSILPADIRSQMRGKTASPGGIGGAAPENAQTARQRERAINPDAEHEEEEKAAEPAEEEHEELKSCPKPTCRTELKDDWIFCAKCGTDLIRGGPAKKLGIVWKEEDLHDYMFKGYVIREVEVLGKFKALIKSSQPKDLQEIDDYIMNGSWSKNKDGSARSVSDFFIRQMNSLCITAVAVQKLNGDSIGATLKERMDWLLERGSAFVDILSQRVVLFNQALSEHVKKEDSILGS